MPTSEVELSLERLVAETSVSRLLDATCVELVELLDASRCSIARIIGDLLVELSDHAQSGEHRRLELFLVSDYPLTLEVIEAGEPRVVMRSDPNADPAEADLLERLGSESLLMARSARAARTGASSRSTRIVRSLSTRSSSRRRSPTGWARSSRSSRAAGSAGPR